jgi:hypothetical protein
MQTSGATISEVKEYTIARLSRNNLKDLAKLHAAVYTTIEEKHYVDKYDTAFMQLEYIGFIAYNLQGLPIAFYGVIPCYIQFGTDRVLAAQSTDTMTHPGYRFKGMFIELSNMTFELCRQLDIKLLFGFPNQNSYKGAIKLGWKLSELMDCFIIPVNSVPLEWASGKNNLFRKLYKAYIRFVFKRKRTGLNGVRNSVLSEGYAGVQRNAEYLLHKTYSDTEVLMIANVKVWINDKHGLVIGDIEGVDETNFKTVIAELKTAAKKTGKRQIQFHSSPGTSIHKLFSSTYTATPSFPVLFQDFGSPIPVEKIKFTLADIDIF